MHLQIQRSNCPLLLGPLDARSGVGTSPGVGRSRPDGHRPSGQ